MRRLEKMGGESYNLPMQEKDPVDPSTNETSKWMGSLSLEILEGTPSPDSGLNPIGVDTAAKHEAFSKVRAFVNFLSANLQGESYSSLRENLLGLASDREIFNAVNLAQVKLSTYFYKKQISNMLKDLSEDDLQKLEELAKKESNPSYFEDDFHLVRIYKKIDQADQIPEGSKKWGALQLICQEFIERGDIDEAIEIAQKISDESVRVCAFRSMSTRLAKKNDIDNALKIADAMPDETTRKFMFGGIARELVKIDKTDEGLKMLDSRMEAGDSIRDINLQGVCRVLIEMGNYDKAISVAKTIFNESSGDISRGWTLLDICLVFIEKNDMDKAVKVVEMISDPLIKAMALVRIGKGDEAMALAEELSDEKSKKYALEYIAMALLGTGKLPLDKIGKFIDIVWKMSNEEVRWKGLKVIFRVVDTMAVEDPSRDCYLEKLCHVSKALGSPFIAVGIAQRISDETKKEALVLGICKELKQTGEGDKASEVIKIIKDSALKDMVLAEINKTDEAITLAS